MLTNSTNGNPENRLPLGSPSQIPNCRAELDSTRSRQARQPNGTTDIDVVVREGKNLKGRVLGFVLRTIGRNVLEKAFENSVKVIEARNEAARLEAAA
jgi:hypothetical protein